MPTATPAATLPRDLIDDLLGEILRREGWPKYTDHPADRGGPTKGGITIPTLSRWRGRPCTADDIRRIEEDEVRAIYRQMYVIEPGYAGIADDQLRCLVVDSAVLYGSDDASPWLQQAANDLGAALKVDGAVGPKTLAAVNALPADPLVLRVCAYRLRKMGRVITDDALRRGRTADQSLNAAGWSNRLAEFLEV
ncbi:glycoside hydrolase family 108 protein [Azospirillum sp. ST 5-10]|uniref:glycoside hydrolase family 108 protein n=1 Tax=unclassified Azospirillum TaxID=2630922 RepID=UPI003F4A423B